MKKIPIPELIKGRVYRIKSRNLQVGVYDGEGGFIGLREKFGSCYLFTEFHWDHDPTYGTVAEQEDTGHDLPDGIEAAESVRHKKKSEDDKRIFDDNDRLYNFLLGYEVGLGLWK